jgi:hypothetical protein
MGGGCCLYAVWVLVSECGDGMILQPSPTIYVFLNFIYILQT